MNPSRNRGAAEINTSAMADIAFLLLVFFLVVTTITEDQGLTLRLPPLPEDREIKKIKDRNLFKVAINSKDQVLVRGEVRDNPSGLREEIKKFIMNYGQDQELSENPAKAVISLKTNRDTGQEIFIAVLDELKAAYHEIYAKRAGMTSQEYRQLDPSDPRQRRIRERAKAAIPMNISIAEPSL